MHVVLDTITWLPNNHDYLSIQSSYRVDEAGMSVGKTLGRTLDRRWKWTVLKGV